MPPETLTNFDGHARKLAARQYHQGDDASIADVFRRVARWIASPEPADDRARYEQTFYDLMADKRFCPGGRVLAGADTGHGNVLNCFCQDGSLHEPGSHAWILELATKLAHVTKGGGGNGLCLDPIKPRSTYEHNGSSLYITISQSHPDYIKVKTGTYMDLVHGKYVTKDYRFAQFVEPDEIPKGVEVYKIGDSVQSIWDNATDITGVLIEGDSVVVDLSDLRPEGQPVNGSGGNSSGPSSFAVEVFDNFGFWSSLGGAEHAGPVATLRYLYAPTLRTIRQGGVRRGAGMATMSADHDDIHDFITCKDLEREQAEGDISTFNISVLATDDLMQRRDPILRDIADHAWQTGEPGLIFVDQINEHNPMRAALGDIKATNPCGEIPLYPGEPCDLGAINLAAYVLGDGAFDYARFHDDIPTYVRFLDNVLEVNKFALEDNRQMSQNLRRLGLGIMGLADALIKMGYRYDSPEGRDVVNDIITVLREEATKASQDLAVERGAFPMFDQSTLVTPRRNIALLTVAPTGTTSMLMGVSSGVEPIFAPFIYRKIGESYHALIAPLFEDLLNVHAPHPDYRTPDFETHDSETGVTTGSWIWDWDKVVEAVQGNHGSVQGLEFIPDAVKDVLVCAHDVSPADHVRMQATVQCAFDAGNDGVANSISKTINMPNESTVQDVSDAYQLAFDEGCKGITVYRDGSRQFQVLSTSSKKSDAKKITAPKAAPAPAVTAPIPTTDRPARLYGFTDTVKLTLANHEQRSFYITVNEQNGSPVEVIVNAGKAGDESNADSEALGRLVSIGLQHGIPVETLIKTLRGINGGMYGSYQHRMVASKADLIAVALESAVHPEQVTALYDGVTCSKCAGPVKFEEGCQTCQHCGDSKCG